MVNLGENLKGIRKANKVLQKDMSQYLEIPLRTYQSYEYGEAEPCLDIIAKLADYFDTTIDYLVGRSCNPSRS